MIAAAWRIISDAASHGVSGPPTASILAALEEGESLKPKAQLCPTASRERDHALYTGLRRRTLSRVTSASTLAHSANPAMLTGHQSVVARGGRRASMKAPQHGQRRPTLRKQIGNSARRRVRPGFGDKQDCASWLRPHRSASHGKQGGRDRYLRPRSAASTIPKSGRLDSASETAAMPLKLKEPRRMCPKLAGEPRSS